MKTDIKHTWYFNHSPQLVWDYLTKPELLSQWLMESDFQPIVGHKFIFNTKPKVKVGFDGIIYCQVLKVDPIILLSYSWKGGPGKDKITLDSIVTWTLIPKDNGTELKLEHTGFVGFKNLLSYLIMNKGWEKIKSRLEKLLANTNK
ncbi:MAG TPA: SRPBCC domain-containing protein [Cytophaga sp.]|jgi:uncharacterized protein YndB with AHSA1/START domain|nr:SRPBCC domain-containing protein [Cytophaga sp.]